MATGMYPGQGKVLYLASANAQEPVFPETAAIPDASYSMGIAVNAGLNTALTVTYTSAPGVATDIEYDSEPSFTNPIVIDTLPITADLINLWATAGNILLQGFIRIRNTSGVTITGVTAQQIAMT